MRELRGELGTAAAGAAALLAGLAATVGLGPAGWLTAAAVVAVTLAALGRAGVPRLGPANRITLARAVLAAGCAGLIADGFTRPLATNVLLILTILALLLDGVDGAVARRTNSVSALGWQFDLEVDAFLILALSVGAARTAGWWVLLIGAARYLAWAAGRAAAWLREPVPPRYWRKIVAAAQGVVLTVAIAGVAPRAVTMVLLALALALLAESFGRDGWWQWRRRGGRPVAITARREWFRAVAGATLTTGAAALVWFALVAPDRLDLLHATAFARVPVEGLVVVALALLLPRRAGLGVVLIAGLALGVVSALRVLDMGFFAELDRPFDPTADFGYLGSAYGVLRDSTGPAGVVLVAVGAIALLATLLVGVPLALLRLTRIAREHRGFAARAVGVLALVWVGCAAVGVRDDGAPVAASAAAGLAYDHADAVVQSIRDERAFATALRAPDPARSIAARDLLRQLRGKDVVVAFVESYGRVALDDPATAAAVRRDGAALEEAGFGSRSAYLTSPTFGGISWLAHSTFESGLWVDSQHRYDALMGSRRDTLAAAFGRAGWRTVADIPADTRDWPDGRRFYRYQQIDDARTVGYHGPKLGYATMPDQFTLQTFAHDELTAGPRAPVMAEIDLVSSHTPWTPLPRLVAPSRVGDGSIYGTAAGRTTPPDDVKQAYAQSIRYSLAALTSFARTANDRNLVLIVLGDHQPRTAVSGADPGHDVPISIVSRDPAVLAEADAWQWTAGLAPHDRAPTWRMDAFRDRFLAAFSGARRS